MINSEPYNPLDTKNLGASVAEALLETTPVSMSEILPFAGAGIYAIYYVGDFEAYHDISERNREGLFQWPLYIGKAIPAGGRKGGGRADGTTGSPLFKRLREHRQSLEAAQNLIVDHFHCRALVVEDIWIPLGEALLISKFAPVWNRLVDGFGNHTPGAGRFAGMRPRWDVLHPGRGWAEHCQPRAETAEQIANEVRAYTRSAVIPAHPRLTNVAD